MTEDTLSTQETCGPCTTHRERHEGIEDEYPAVEFRPGDSRMDLVALIANAAQQSIEPLNQLRSIVRGAQNRIHSTHELQ
ncbi:hypothetical protein Hrd1104_03505 [Halorhabdus sp. CBA1104]|nr:hypothetical protein Hrd1104_03505 [Halorhabdus sp. CBA1104]